jgi:hypothetical protein
MRLKAVLANAGITLLLSCAHSVASHFHPLAMGEVPKGLTPHDPVTCAAGAERCYADGLALLRDRRAPSDAFRALFAACSVGSLAACQYLNEHFESPSGSGSLPPLPPEITTAMQQGTWAKVYAFCHLGSDGVLGDCVAHDIVPTLTPAYLRWLKGQRMTPARLDGHAIDCDITLQLHLTRPFQ